LAREALDGGLCCFLRLVEQWVLLKELGELLAVQGQDGQQVVQEREKGGLQAVRELELGERQRVELVAACGQGQQVE